jgi:hypothetical protein
MNALYYTVVASCMAVFAIPNFPSYGSFEKLNNFS